MFEMNIGPRDEPWPNSTNVCVPIVHLMHQSVFSEIASAVFVPRLFVISPLDEAAAEFSHQTEDYYNGQYHLNKEIVTYLTCLNLALRDGISYMETLWEEKISVRRIAIVETDPLTGIKKKTIKLKEIVDYRGTKDTPVEYRDLILAPATAKDPDSASAVFRRLYVSEGTLWDMVRAGMLWEDAVKEIIAIHSTGMSDLPDGDTATYEQGGTIEVSDEGVTGDPAQSLGIFELYRVHTNMFDLDEDKVWEENVLFFYHKTPTLVGGNRYKYWMDRRPFSKLAPIERPNRNEGFAIGEINRSMQEEANARHNQRGDSMDVQVMPGMYQTGSAELLTPETPIGPKARWKVNSKDDVGIIQFGSLTPDTWEEESLLLSYAIKVSGLEAAAMPLPGGAKVPQKLQAGFKTQSNIRLDLMALNTRLWLQNILEIKHQLNIQYMDDETANNMGGSGLETMLDGERLKLPFEALVQKYQLGVAGTQGALDQEARSDNVKMLYALLMQNPLVQGHLDRVWEVTSLVLQDANLPQYTKFIGTIDDAKKQGEQMAQAAKQQHDEQLQLQMASHSKNPSPAMSPPPQNGAAPNAQIGSS